MFKSMKKFKGKLLEGLQVDDLCGNKSSKSISGSKEDNKISESISGSKNVSSFRMRKC